MLCIRTLEWYDTGIIEVACTLVRDDDRLVKQARQVPRLTSTLSAGSDGVHRPNRRRKPAGRGIEPCNSADLRICHSQPMLLSPAQ